MTRVDMKKNNIEVYAFSLADRNYFRLPLDVIIYIFCYINLRYLLLLTVHIFEYK